jgi:uncharacterized protein YycO
MSQVFIGFSKPKNKIFPWFSWLIRIVEKTPYSHVFVRIPSNSLGVDLIYQASGVAVNFVGTKHFNDAVCVIKEFPFEISEEGKTALLRWAVSEAGVPYGVKAILGILLVKCFNLKRNPFSDGQKTWVCSELAGAVLRDFFGAEISDDALEILGPSGIFDICQRIKGA